MKLLIKVLCFFLATNLYAQLKTTIVIESLTGYENNIFKSPKSFLNSNGELLTDKQLYESSFYQTGDLKFIAKKEWRKQSISFRINPRGNYYYSENDASYFTIYSGIKYENILSKKTKWQIQSRYNFRNRKGDNVDGSELNFPLGYGHFDFSTGMHYRLYKQNRSFIKIIYGNRNYKKTNTNEISYNSLGVNTIFRNVYKRDAGWHSYGIEASFINKYFQQKNQVENTNEKFNWKDVSVGAFYRYPVTKKLDVKPLFTFKKRIDSKNDKFTYTQLKPSLNIAYKTTKIHFDVIGSYVNRKYKTLEATNTDWNKLGKLKYTYYQLKVVAKMKLNKKLSVVSKSYINNRTSNKTNMKSIYFRDYNYYYTGIGLKYTF